MPPTHTPRVSPRVYFLLDRATKLAALALLSVALVPEAFPRYSILLGVLGVLVGLITVVVQPEEDDTE
ncbi:hypothetical protein [Halocalculus aciditolerans]|uniref:DUF8120 domain-containing protein n=1 Tax=Halocalculus aciditolerans TaxID=1383812 RepID=A0A830FFH8_9EURY|nr:hypothetical protein [Halocalculus aciditolerans]GGL69767.1 hypothetical protein GCM10009039_29710 [Halocalculus aciditolerans]